MPTIYEISAQLDISLRTLRKLDKKGYLKAAKSADPITDSARENLRKGNNLTALQQLHFLRDPAARDSLAQYQFEIDAQMDKLGDALADAAPWDISSAIELAARREQGAIDKISNWLFSFIRVSEHFDKGATQDHAFIVVRLLANVPDHSLESLAKRAQACMWQCRRGSNLSECWKLSDKGQTLYFRPNKKAVAKFDL